MFADGSTVQVHLHMHYMRVHGINPRAPIGTDLLREARQGDVHRLHVLCHSNDKNDKNNETITCPLAQ